MTNFSKIKVGTWFTASDGEKYKKTSELTYDDSYGLERYIDPLFDKKIGSTVADTSKTIDTSAKVVKGSSEETVDTSAKVVKTPKKRAAKKSKTK